MLLLVNHKLSLFYFEIIGFQNIWKKLHLIHIVIHSVLFVNLKSILSRLPFVTVMTQTEEAFTQGWGSNLPFNLSKIFYLRSHLPRLGILKCKVHGHMLRSQAALIYPAAITNYGTVVKCFESVLLQQQLGHCWENHVLAFVLQQL